MDNEIPTPADDLKQRAVEFVMTLANAAATPRDIGWACSRAMLALYGVNTDYEGCSKGLDRIRDIKN